MDVDVAANLKAFLSDRAPEGRYASFDYCFNYFQDARECDELARLADGDGLLLSCLQLGFYLASWGMMRGSSRLLQKSARDLIPLVRLIAEEPASSWDLDVDSYADHADDVLALSRRIRLAFTGGASDTLVTKTMLGVFGCVPAFDRYFCVGSGCSTLCKRALLKIGAFYEAHRADLETMDVRTLGFASGVDTARCYTQAN